MSLRVESEPIVFEILHRRVFEHGAKIEQVALTGPPELSIQQVEMGSEGDLRESAGFRFVDTSYRVTVISQKLRLHKARSRF